MEKPLYDVADIAADLSISPEDAAELLLELGRRLKKQGFLVIQDRIPRAYYESQKAAGFPMDISEPDASRIPLNERRLLDLGDFCIYAGGIGTATARKFIKQEGLVVRIGGRCLVDREGFDRWCERNRAK